MRALLLLNQLAVGGTERKSVKLANEFIDRFDCAVLAYLNGPEDLLPTIDARVPTACLHRKGKVSLKAIRNLRRLVDEHEISLVLCMNLYPLLYAGLLKLFFGRSSLKVVLAINTTEFERGRDRWFMSIYAPLIRRIDAVIYGCEYQMKLWHDRYRLDRVPSHVIYNGVDTEVFDRAAAPGDLRGEIGLGDSFVIGSVGRLSPEKNQSLLLEAAAVLNENGRCDVVLAGSGPEQSALERRSAELGIRNRVHFLGRTDDVRAALATMDVFVLPSVVETFSNAALEAMSMSVPVVLSNVGGNPETVSDGIDGFLFEAENVNELSDVLTRLRDDRDSRRRISRQARSTVVERFGVGRMFDDYEAVFERV